MSSSASAYRMSGRFRGFLPVAVDVETGGFNASTDALLEIAAVVIEMSPVGQLRPGPARHESAAPIRGRPGRTLLGRRRRSRRRLAPALARAPSAGRKPNPK